MKRRALLGLIVALALVLPFLRPTEPSTGFAAPAATAQPSPAPITSPAPSIRTISLAANDLIYDPDTERIYASVPGTAGARGNSITPLDPATGNLGTSVVVGSEPTKLARADNGQYLYVGLNGAAAVRRFELATQTAGLQFPLGSDSYFGPYYPEDLAVLPGDPTRVAVSRYSPRISPRHQGVGIYADGALLPTQTPGHTGSNVIEFCASAATLYGYNNETSDYGFRRMAVAGSGVSVSDSTQNLIYGSADIECAGGLIYATTGRVIHPSNRNLVATYPGISWGALVEPDPTVGRTFFLVPGSGGIYRLLTFSQETFSLLGAFDIAGVSGTLGSLVRWGSDGLAFRTTGGQVFLVQHPLISGAAAPAVTLRPSSVGFGNQQMGASSRAQTITLINTGNAPLGITRVGLAGANPGDFVLDASCPASPATLAPGASCPITITFRPTLTGARAATLAVTSDAVGSPQLVALNGVGTGSTALPAIRTLGLPAPPDRLA
jgi:hypothetical protein